MKYKRIFTIVIDSLGVGAEPDAAQYDDEGTDTLGHISEAKKTCIFRICKSSASPTFTRWPISKQ